MRKLFKHILMVAALCVVFPVAGWSMGTPSSFTVDLSAARGSPVSGNALQQQMTGASINLSVANPLTGATSTSTSFFDVIWEFDYATNHMVIAGTSAPPATGSCLIGRTVTVVDSRTGIGIVGATVTLQGTTLTTDNSGIATFTGVNGLTSGNVTIDASASGYGAAHEAVTAACGTSGATTITLLTTAIAASGDVTIVLTWGANPRDLDSHLTGPKTTGATPRFHVYYGYRNSTGTGNAMTVSTATVPAFLDLDDTSSYGPETTTILSTAPDGIYRFSVRHFSGTSTIENSGAVVKIYQGGTLLSTLTPPAGQGATSSGRYWSVAEINMASGVPSITTIGTYGTTWAASVIGAPSGGTPVVTPIGVTVHGEDPAIFQGLPAK